MSQSNKKQHVMLSYEWSIQNLVLSVHGYLQKKHIPLWMDIKSGVTSDNLYDKLAEAIENSACFICFMTPQYQESPFCKQELQYAKQCNIPIIPLKVEENWNPTSWLGLITVGLIWLDFYNISDLRMKVNELYDYIVKIVGNRFQPENVFKANSVVQRETNRFSQASNVPKHSLNRTNSRGRRARLPSTNPWSEFSIENDHSEGMSATVVHRPRIRSPQNFLPNDDPMQIPRLPSNAARRKNRCKFGT